MEYGGFYLDKPVGNNKFSFDERIIKKIFIPKLVDSKIDELSMGDKAVFIEIDDGHEYSCMGLKNMYRLVDDNIFPKKNVYVFDNHNHAFYFWCKSLKDGMMKKGMTLVHVDQHKDTREPENYYVDINDIEDVERYTNEVLNVGNFIKPALYHGIFDKLIIIDSDYGLDVDVPDEFVLDIDLDFFSKEMEYINFQKKLDKIREYIKRAKVITIATSPYFIEQERAVSALKLLFVVEK